MTKEAVTITTRSNQTVSVEHDRRHVLLRIGEGYQSKAIELDWMSLRELISALKHA